MFVVHKLIALLLSLGMTGGHQSAPEWRQQLKGHLDQLVDEGVPGALARVHNDGTTWTVRSGVANLKKATPMRSKLRYRVASETKTFVAALMLKLSEEGVLTLDDTLDSWLPGLVPNGSAITVRHLLNHTSGIFNYTDDASVFEPYLQDDRDHVWLPEELVAVAMAHDPLFEPGTDWSYSNTGYILAGMIAEKATGVSLPELLRTKIFDPLGLQDTYLPTEPGLAGPHSHGYLLPGQDLPLPKDKPLDVTRFSPSWAWAAGGIISDSGDIQHFYAELLGGNVLSPESLEEMKSTVDAGYGLDYGLGLLSAPTPCGRAWGHDGSFPGFFSIALSTEDGAAQVVLMRNATEVVSRAGERAFAKATVVGFCRNKVVDESVVSRFAGMGRALR